MQDAQAQTAGVLRLALVIGNAAYPGDAALGNPANDALAMADTLRQLGFQVIEVRDASRAQMTEAIATVRATLQGKQAIGMLYYAGHGLQLEWRNFMVPVDAKIVSSADIPTQAVDVGLVVDAFKAAGNRMNIVVLDACRDNPFATTASGKGLAQIDAPPGTFLAFATAPGNVAIDGDAKSGNGLYTGFLLEELRKPAATIENVFKRVRLNVRMQSKGRQIPWESTSLEDDFVFNTGVKVATRDERAREEAFRVEKGDWDRISNSKNADDFYAFLLKYPSGNMSELAQSQVERLDRAKVLAQADQAGQTQGPWAPRFRLGDTAQYQTRDGVTGPVKERRTAMVTFAMGTTVFTSDLFATDQNDIFTTGGALSRDGKVQNDPPVQLLPGGEYQVGKRWKGRSRQFQGRSGHSTWLDFEGHVAGIENITTPAGTFVAYKVVVEFQYESGQFTRSTYWMQPDWGFPLKRQYEVRRWFGRFDVTVDELLERKRGSI